MSTVAPPYRLSQAAAVVALSDRQGLKAQQQARVAGARPSAPEGPPPLPGEALRDLVGRVTMEIMPVSSTPVLSHRSTGRKRAMRALISAVSGLGVLLSLLATAPARADVASSPSAPAAAIGARATWTAPAFVRTMGARGSAGLYAWGVAYNPVTNETLVGDYLNYQVRRFSTGGTLLGSFYRSPADRRGVPEGLAVDPRNGDIYVSDHSRDNRGYLAKFRADGTFICEFKLNASYHAWITVDTDGYVYVSDSQSWNNATNPPQVRKYRMDDSSMTATQVANWGVYGTGEGQIRLITGLAVDPATGRVFVADGVNRKVVVYAANGTYLSTYGVGRFAGDLRGVALNARTRQLYVVDSNSGGVERFNADTGASLGRFGSLGTGPGQFGDGGRQVAIDASGNVWVADYSNTRVLKFTGTGTYIGAYPNPPQNAPKGALAMVRDVAIQPSSKAVWAVEQNNQRIQKFRADGVPAGAWGRRSSSRPLGFNYPRGIAIQPGSERIWIANTTDSKVRVLNPNRTLAMELGSGVGSGVGQFSEPIDIEFGNGNVYVGDANGRDVKILNPATGAETGSMDVAAAGVAVDPATGDIYLTSWYTDLVYHFKASGAPATPATFSGPGSGPGQLLNPWDVDVINGLVYVSDADRAVILVFQSDGTFLGEFGGSGSRAGQFNNPSGLTHDAAGRLYVADAGNDRIVVYDTAATLPREAIQPAVSLSSPRAQATLSAPVELNGSVTDNARVGTVEVAIQNRVTKAWWDGRISTWSAAKQWTNAGTKGGNLKSMQWWFPFIGAAYRGDYLLQVRSFDANGNMSKTLETTFKVSG